MHSLVFEEKNAEVDRPSRHRRRTTFWVTLAVATYIVMRLLSLLEGLSAADSGLRASTKPRENWGRIRQQTLAVVSLRNQMTMRNPFDQCHNLCQVSLVHLMQRSCGLFRKEDAVCARIRLLVGYEGEDSFRLDREVGSDLSADYLAQRTL